MAIKIFITKNKIMSAIHTGHLLHELETYAGKYQLSFQFWGADNNNVYISKDDVELTSFGGHETIADVLLVALNYLRRINGIKIEPNA